MTVKNSIFFSMLILINCSEQTNFKFFPKNSIISDSYSSNNINYNEQPHKKLYFQSEKSLTLLAFVNNMLVLFTDFV